MTKGKGLLLLLLLLVVAMACQVDSIRWLGLYRYARQKSQERVPFSKSECWHSHVRFGLDKRQLRFCQQPDTAPVMHAIVKSAQAVAYYCPQTFKDRRWNCSSVEFLPEVLPDLALGTREQAVVYAMASGAMLFEIARRCAMDKIEGCHCGRPEWTGPGSGGGDETSDLDPAMQQDDSYGRAYEANVENSAHAYVWNGCADNVDLAHYYVKRFLAYERMKEGNQFNRRRRRQMNRRQISPEQQPILARNVRNPRRAGPFRAVRQAEPQEQPDQTAQEAAQLPDKPVPVMRLLNGHNYEVGLKIMEQNRRYTCRCQGVSGSCLQKICFRQFLRLDSTQLQNAFLKQYLQSKNVELNGIGQALQAKEFRFGSFVSTPLKPTDLAFVEHSPDYCEPDPAKGSFGTSGRLCHLKDANGPAVWGDCQHMCCRRGYYQDVATKYEPCKCRITPQFKVECDECPVEVRKTYCK